MPSWQALILTEPSHPPYLKYFKAIDVQDSNVVLLVVLLHGFIDRLGENKHSADNSFHSFFFFKIYLFYVCEYAVAVFRHIRRSHYRWL